MRLIGAIVLVLCAFAGNSILGRLGVFHYQMDALSFALVRVTAGAVTLAVLVWGRGGALPLSGGLRIGGALALSVYLLGFSWAYVSLDAGLGALILFGVVQLVMFGWASARGQGTTWLGWAGAGIAFAGLVLLLWPTDALRVDPRAAAAMSVAGLGWGIYSLLGKAEADPLAATASNFVLSIPLVCIGMLAVAGWSWTFGGLLAAIVSGAVTSGLGYALWYRVLSQITPTVAAVLQLCVPVIAVAAGVVLLAEPLSAKLIAASALVLGGVAVSVLKGR